MHPDELAVPETVSSQKKIGVLLVNLGTPEGTDYWSVRRYLKEFLSDRRVVETSPLVWWPILNLAILSIRPQRSGKAYRKVWNTEQNESPLKTITRAQADALTAWIDMGGLAEETGSGPAIRVAWAMRYGLPSIAQEVGRLIDEGCDRLLVVPLIRNIPPRRRRLSETPSSRRWNAGGFSRRCGSLRPIMMIRHISRRSPTHCARRLPVWPSRLMSSSFRITAFRKPMPTEATSIRGIVKKPSAC